MNKIDKDTKKAQDGMQEDTKDPQENDVILLINMFSGSFLFDNTAHEMINLFRTDEGNSYLYVPPKGNMAEKVDKILMVRHLGSGIYEVLGRATGLENITSEEKQEEHIEGITFNEQSVVDVIGLDREKGEKITFLAESCESPLQPLYIDCRTKDNARARAPYDDNPTVIDMRELDQDKSAIDKLFGQSQRRYIRKKNHGEVYDLLNGLFDEGDEKYKKYKGDWENFPTYEEYESKLNSSQSETGNKQEKPDPRFLSLISKEDSELAYSNMLAYFLEKEKSLCSSFLSSLLKNHSDEVKLTRSVSPNNSDKGLIPLSIAREEKHIDLLISTADIIFILENKINAPLDDTKRLPYGKTKKELSDEQKAELEKVENRYKEAEKNLKDREYLAFGQLQNYVDDVLKELSSSGFEKDILVFILCPSRHELYKDYKKSRRGDPEGKRRMVIMDEAGKDIRPIPVISYSEVLESLKEATVQVGFGFKNLTDRERAYFDDFLSMLKWQESEDHSDQNKMFMNKSRERFMRAVEAAKETPAKTPLGA